MRIIIFSLCIIFFICCEESTKPEESSTKMSFSPANISLAVGEDSNIKLNIENCTKSIFGMSIRIEYDNSVVSFSHSDGLILGDFLGQNAIIFTKDHNSVIHMTLSLTQGQTEVSGSGVLDILTFTGKTTGNCILQIFSEDLHFFDSEGNLVFLESIELETSTITVQ